jgi:fumarate hydratase class I
MSIIKESDFIQSIADGFQFISYYHPLDYIQSLHEAYQREQSPAARDAMAQILVNSRMSAQGHRPICQDTGSAVVFLEVGMNVQWDARRSVEDMVNEGVRQAYSHPDNVLRASMVADPLGKRQNTRDNTPAIIHTRIVPGDHVTVKLAAKGGGSENKSKFTVLNPSASLVDWVVDTVPTMGAGWCPPGMLGIGVGGTAEKAMLLAKESLMEPINIHQLMEKGPSSRVEELRLEIYDKVNALGIGAQGLGGMTTVLDVKIADYPTHAASLPVGMIPNCAATRHIEFELDGSGPAILTPPALSDWPDITWEVDASTIHVNLDTVTAEEMAQWKPGDRLLLSGKMLTGRDAAHKRIADILSRGESLPEGVDFTNRFIYYVGPVDPVGDEVVGPAGPTTSTRMDKYTEMMLGQTGLMGMIGKAERGPAAIESIKKHKASYLMAVGGAAYLVAQAIKSSRMVAFEDLGMEAIREFEVENMPVTVAVDTEGNSVHQSGPAEWKVKIADMMK